MNENELFEKAPIPKAYFTMALPVVFSMVVSLIYNVVDTYFIAKTQNASLVAAVSLCAPLFTLMIALGDIFGIGGSSVLSRLFGQKKTIWQEMPVVSVYMVLLYVGYSLLVSSFFLRILFYIF